MMFRSIRKLLVFLLAVLLTASLSVSAVRAADMTMKMSTSSTTMLVGQGDMSGCGGADTNKVKAGSCAAICGASILATLDPPTHAGVATIAGIVTIPEDRLLSSAEPPPEPYPPKSI